MFKPMTEKDFEVACSLIAKINRNALSYFKKGYEENSVLASLLYKSENNEGIISIVEQEEFFVSYVSFLQDPQAEIMAEIKEQVNELIAKVKDKELYINVNLNNPSVIAYLRENNFSDDGSGKEYKSSLTEGFLPESQLESKKFEMEKADQYLEVIDEAFADLDRACNVEPNRMRKNREGSIEAIQTVDSRDNFRAFWLKDKLVGVYFLKEDVINIIAVHPKYQSQGYGKEILQFCLHQMLNEKKLQDVYLYVINKNEGAQRFYANNGFEVTGSYSENTYSPQTA